jgi:hypothetical protein
VQLPVLRDKTRVDVSCLVQDFPPLLQQSLSPIAFALLLILLTSSGFYFLRRSSTIFDDFRLSLNERILIIKQIRISDTSSPIKISLRRLSNFYPFLALLIIIFAKACIFKHCPPDVFS